MVQLKVMSGKMAGTVKKARRFPVRIGRSPSSDLPLDDSGVWDQHLRIEFDPERGFIAVPEPKALLSVNGEAAQETALRNGTFWMLEERSCSSGWRRRTRRRSGCGSGWSG